MSRNGKKDKAMKEKPHDRIAEEISSENSPNKGEPSVAERYVVDKNNTIGAKFDDSDPTAALNLEGDVDDKGTSRMETDDIQTIYKGLRGHQQLVCQLDLQRKQLLLKKMITPQKNKNKTVD